MYEYISECDGEHIHIHTQNFARQKICSSSKQIRKGHRVLSFIADFEWIVEICKYICMYVNMYALKTLSITFSRDFTTFVFIIETWIALHSK